MPTVGAFVQDYVLLVARKHVLSTASLPAEQLRLAQSQMEELIRSLRGVAETWVVFEHGTVGRAMGAPCCVEHLHLHLVAMDWDLATALSQALSVPAYRMDSLLQLPDVAGGMHMNYLFVRNPDGRYYCLRVEAIPSQFVRQVIASHCQRPWLWDWRRHPMPEASVAGTHRIELALRGGG
jgi:diadenosine tetraphosphate (Ap4A) HIT family hydrolase